MIDTALAHIARIARREPLAHIEGSLGFAFNGATLYIHPVSSYMQAADQPKDETAPKIPQLTPRELEVLARMCEGDTNDEIATVLGVSSHVVKFHVKNLSAKLEHTTRTGAAVAAVRLGIVA